VDDNAKVLLDTLLVGRADEQDGDPLPDDKLFELFALEQILKHTEISQEEVVAGQIGGGDDGGIDGLYSFLDGTLLEEDAVILEEDFDPRKVKTGAELSLVLVQAKRSDSFTETAIQKIDRTLSEILDLSKDEEYLREVLSPEIAERAEIFRRSWERLATRHPVISVQMRYVTKGDTRKVNEKVAKRAKRLQAAIADVNPRATATVDLIGARELVDLAAEEKTYTLQLAYSEMATADQSHLLLVRLDDYLNFISDEGSLRKHIFDWNVRDYEGGVEVNKEILKSLEDPNGPEFWWLNNGVTVICSQASSQGKTLSLDDVQVVNGLQSSVSIYNYLSGAEEGDPSRSRSILVRVIATQDPDTRDRVIRATNRQTAVQAASLRATDSIQRDLEQYFFGEDWYYERRKNYYRNQGKPAARIITIPYLAQAVLAMGFSDPSNSRARPSSLLKRDADYNRIFDPKTDYGVYLWLAKAQKTVDGVLRSAKLKSGGHTNLRFHTAMTVVVKRFGERVYSPKQLVSLLADEVVVSEVPPAAKAVADALEAYSKETGMDRLDQMVKSGDFTEYLVGRLFPGEP
jgi:hypothetical protein